jgi:hypothetical protein
VNQQILKETWDLVTHGIAVSCLGDHQCAAHFVAGDRELATLQGMAAMGDVASALATAIGARRTDDAWAKDPKKVAMAVRDILRNPLSSMYSGDSQVRTHPFIPRPLSTPLTLGIG